MKFSGRVGSWAETTTPNIVTLAQAASASVANPT